MTIISKYNGKCSRCGHWMPAGSAIEWKKGKGATHTTEAACLVARAKAAPAEAPLSVNLKPIADFIAAAEGRAKETAVKTGRKPAAPRLRVLSPGGGELVLGLTKVGHAPGSISVLERGTFIGCVRPTGAVTGPLSERPEIHAALLAVAAEPAAAAKAYAALMSKCCFCNSKLEDAGSVELGYGPVCAKNWGLPHKALGTPTLVTPEVAA